MGYVCQRVAIYPKSGDTWDENTETVIADATQVTVNKGVGKTKNSYSFALPKSRLHFLSANNPLENENLVKIWIWRDKVDYDDTDLKIEGTIRSVEQSYDDSGDMATIKGDDFTEVFFDTQIPLNQKDKQWPDIVKEILAQLRDFTNKPIYWHPDNPTVKSDGNEFPNKTLILNYTRVSEMIEKLTSDEFTTDGQYLYWIQKIGTKYYLKVIFKSSTIAGTITQGEKGFQIKIQKKKEDIKNFVIYNCGTDLYGNPVEDVYYDTSSIGKYGFKTYYTTEETQDLFVNYWNTERYANTSVFTPDSEGKPTDDFPDTYNYTFIDGTVVTDDEEFNDHLKTIALTQGLIIATAIVKNTSKPKYTLEHNQRFSNIYNRGEKWQCVFPMRNINRPLRIMEIKHTIVETSLTLEEDEVDATL